MMRSPDRDAANYYQKSLNCEEKKHYDEAIFYCKKAFEIRPNDSILSDQLKRLQALKSHQSESSQPFRVSPQSTHNYSYGVIHQKLRDKPTISLNSQQKKQKTESDSDTGGIYPDKSTLIPRRLNFSGPPIPVSTKLSDVNLLPVQNLPRLGKWEPFNPKESYAVDLTNDEYNAVQTENRTALPTSKKDLKEEKTRERIETGKIGERHMYQYFLNSYLEKGYTVSKEERNGVLLQASCGIQTVEIIWCNKDQESGYPYDLVLKEEQNGRVISTKYIEVKSTKNDETIPSSTTFSGGELNAMRYYDTDYCIYRVYNAHPKGKPKEKKIDNFYKEIFSQPIDPSGKSDLETLVTDITSIKIRI